jgi:acid phosphatase (class A)
MAVRERIVTLDFRLALRGKARLGAVVLAGALAGALALAAVDVSAQGKPRLTGYLTEAPSGLGFLPGPPEPGSAQDLADHQTYLATRALKDTPRWALAQEDDDIGPSGAGRIFDCALGTRLGQDQPPAVTRLLTRVLIDVQKSYTPAKDQFKRPRPLVGNDAPICVTRDDRLAASYSHPSGHASISWAWALALSEIEPDRAGAILKRGASVGDSRVVCGVHYVSDIQAGRMVGAAVFAAEQNSPEFLADLKAAKAEIDARRAEGKTNPICAAQAEALKVRVY